MLELSCIIDVLLKDNKGKFKYWMMNKLGFRLFLLDAKLYREFCESDEDFEETYTPETWVYDTDVEPGTYKDSTGLALYLGYGAELR